MVGSFHRPRIDMGETGNPSENWRVKSLIYSCILMRITLNPKSANRMPIKSTLEHTTKKKTKLALLNRSKFQGSHQKPRRAKRRHLSYLEMVTRHNNIVVVDRVQHNQRQTRNERKPTLLKERKIWVNKFPNLNSKAHNRVQCKKSNCWNMVFDGKTGN